MIFKTRLPVTIFATGLSITSLGIISTVLAAPVDDLLTQYQTQGAGEPAPESGQKQWTQIYTNNNKSEKRSCDTCHTRNLQNEGKQVNTGKRIEPLAPSANRERLTDRKKIEKWFKRNCKWTLGRECTPQEKSDFLSYIRQQ